LERLGRGLDLTALQKALTYCIELHSGCATEQQLVDFMISNWQDIQGISKHTFQQDPGMRLLRVNTRLTKHGDFLFLKVPPDKFRLNDPGDFVGERTHQSSDTNEDGNGIDKYESGASARDSEPAHGPDSDLGPDSEEDGDEGGYIWDDKESPPNVEAGLDFEDRLLESVTNAELKGIEEKVLIREAVSFASVPGQFEYLELPKRMRAVLLSLKLAGRIFWDSGSKLWTREPIRKRLEMLYRLERDVIGKGALVISQPELYEKLQTRNLTVKNRLLPHIIRAMWLSKRQ
jgi:hypothetical protein